MESSLPSAPCSSFDWQYESCSLQMVHPPALNIHNTIHTDSITTAKPASYPLPWNELYQINSKTNASPPNPTYPAPLPPKAYTQKYTTTKTTCIHISTKAARRVTHSVTGILGCQHLSRFWHHRCIPQSQNRAHPRIPRCLWFYSMHQECFSQRHWKTGISTTWIVMKLERSFRKFATTVARINCYFLTWYIYKHAQSRM